MLTKEEVLKTIERALSENLEGLEYQLTFLSTPSAAAEAPTPQESWLVLFQVLGIEPAPKDKAYPPYLIARVNTLASSTGGLVFNVSKALEIRDLRVTMKVENPYERDEQCLNYLHYFMLSLGLELRKYIEHQNSIDAQNAA